MASRVGGVVQENYSVGRTNGVPKGARKGGRKPLGDLSNAQQRSLNQASKKYNSGILAGVSQKKKSTSELRKPLSDISNSGRPKLNQGTKNNNAAKLCVMEEEPIDDNEIAEEGFLHNHKKCIKQQLNSWGLDLFLPTIDNSKDQETPVPCHSPPSSPLQVHFEEMLEEDFITVKHKFASPLDSPLSLDSPPSSRFFRYFMDYECKFELGSP